jgi:hypothetical protein
MERSPSRESDTRSASREISRFLQNPKFHHIQENPLLDTTQSQKKQLNAVRLYLVTLPWNAIYHTVTAKGIDLWSKIYEFKTRNGIPNSPFRDLKFPPVRHARLSSHPTSPVPKFTEPLHLGLKLKSSFYFSY